MKKMIQKLREENGGFTLAELLIVVAIIAVLVAVAIPVFTGSLHSSRAATDEANARSLYADLQADYLTNSGNSAYAAATWDESLKDGATVAKSGSFKLSDGETITLQDSDTSLELKFTAGSGWGVKITCDGKKIGTDGTETWGVGF